MKKSSCTWQCTCRTFHRQLGTLGTIGDRHQAEYHAFHQCHCTVHSCKPLPQRCNERLPDGICHIGFAYIRMTRHDHKPACKNEKRKKSSFKNQLQKQRRLICLPFALDSSSFQCPKFFLIFSCFFAIFFVFIFKYF